MNTRIRGIASGFLATCGVLMIILSTVNDAWAEDMPTFHLTAQNGTFIPDTLAVPVNQRFRIAVTNKGPGPEEFESTDLHIETVLTSGATRTVVVGPLSTGSFAFFGEFHPDTAKVTIIAK